jgi:hypothetical protein
MAPAQSLRNQTLGQPYSLIVRQVRTFADERLGGFCVYCHGRPTTRDHVPPRALLDRPYPENLPVVSSCHACNEGASLDEEYVACLLEVGACGSASPSDLVRSSIARKLTENARLQARLARAVKTDGSTVWVEAETERVALVVEKIAKALWNFEGAETAAVLRPTTRFAPLSALTSDERAEFLQVAQPQMWPEVGSRLMIRLVTGGNDRWGLWEHVQDSRFSYAIEIRRADVRIKMLLRNYLAATVTLGGYEVAQSDPTAHRDFGLRPSE